jgi:ABC-2 type transport system permease protein
MRQLWAVVAKEFVHIRRDRFMLVFMVGLPLLLLLLFGYALRLSVENLTAAVLDQDKTFMSLQVRDRLQREGRLIIQEVDSEQAIKDMLKMGTVRLGLVIPRGFSAHLAGQEQTTFQLYVDGTMPTLAQAAIYGVGVLTDEDAAATFVVDTPDHPAKAVRKAPIKIESAILFNPQLRDSDFFLPGTIGIVIMIVTLTLATGLIREKEQQTIEQLMVTPLSKFALIAGKLIPYAIVSTLDLVLVAVLAKVVFGLPVRGSTVAVGALGVLFILALLALGSLIATLARNQLQANFVGVFIIVPSVLLSGFAFPLEAMPDWLRPISWTLPMTYFVEAIRGLTLKGTTVAEQWRDFVALAAFLFGFLGLSVSLFRKQVS